MVRQMQGAAMRIAAATLVMAGAMAWTINAGPDGSKIAFEGDRFGDWGIALMHPDGNGAFSLNVPGAADASWSPNGQHVAV